MSSEPVFWRKKTEIKASSLIVFSSVSAEIKVGQCCNYQPWYIVRCEHKIPDEFHVTRNYWSLWKAFVIVFFQRFGIRSNCLGYPFEKIYHWKRNAVRSKDPGNLFEKNCHAFERLALFVGKNCHPPFQLLGLSVQRIVIRLNGSSYPF